MALYFNLFSKCSWPVRNAGLRVTAQALNSGTENDDKKMLQAIELKCTDLKVCAFIKGWLAVIFGPGLIEFSQAPDFIPAFVTGTIVTTIYYRMLYSTVIAEAATEYGRVYSPKVNLTMSESNVSSLVTDQEPAKNRLI